MIRALVIGYGSIGQRHGRILAEAGCDVAVVSRRETLDLPRFTDIPSAIAAHRPDYIVIADETARHRSSLGAVDATGFGGTLLVEKPLYAAPDAFRPRGADTYVAYNLRFHPLLRRLRALLADRPVISAEIHVGQYLPDWRPGRDWQQGYSARRDGGGGVLRDLSHELDYALWLFGPWQRVTALGGNSGALAIETDDTWQALLVCERAPQLSISLNYLNRRPRRQIWINTGDDTIEVDLIAGRIESKAGTETQTLDRDATYRAMHAALLRGTPDGCCSLAEGLDVVTTVAAIERAAAERSWVNA